MSDINKGPAVGAPELPWYSILRVNFSTLAVLVTLLVTIGGVWVRIQANERDVSELKASAKSKESADADMKLVLSKLDDLRDRLDRIERQQTESPRKDGR